MKIFHRQDWASRAVETMKAQKITQDVLCRALGVTPAAISHYMTGRRDPSLAQLAVIAKTLKMSAAELVYGIDYQHPTISILKWAEVSTWSANTSYARKQAGKETIPYFYAHNNGIYALRVQDDSMFSPLSLTQSFRENTIIVVDPTKILHENQFVIAICNRTQEAVLRQYVKTQGKYYLKPINQQYPMVAVDETIELKGTVIAQMTVYE